MRLGLRVQSAPWASIQHVDVAVPHTGRWRLSLYDVQWRRLATLLDQQVEAGDHDVSWSRNGVRGTAIGVYFYRLTDGRDEIARNIVLLR